MKLMAIGGINHGTNDDAYLKTWEQFIVPVATSTDSFLFPAASASIPSPQFASEQVMDKTAIVAPNGRLLFQAKLALRGCSPFNSILSPSDNPTWHRLNPLTVTIKISDEDNGSNCGGKKKYYVIKKEAIPTDLGFRQSVTVYSCGRMSFSMSHNVEVGIDGNNPMLKSFIRDMQEQGFLTSHDENVRFNLTEILLQVFGLLNMPDSVPERLYGPTPAQIEVDNRLQALSAELSQINDQMKIMAITRDLPGSDPVEDPITAARPRVVELVGDILRHHLSPRSVKDVNECLLIFLPEFVPDRLLGDFFAQPEVQTAIAAWNSKAKTRSFLIREFFQVFDWRQPNLQNVFYGLQLLGLQIKNAAELNLDKIHYFNRRLGIDWQKKLEQGLLEREEYYATVREFYDSLFSRVISPDIIAAYRKNSRLFFREILAGFNDKTILSARDKGIRIPYVIKNVIGET